jgi:hypothetical protein
VTPTVEDWIAHARASTNPAELERYLASAAAAADSLEDWRTLLNWTADLPLASRDRLVHAADRTLARARGTRTTWGHRDVAAIRAKRLGDATGARTALEACEQALSAPVSDRADRRNVARGFDWVLLATSYAEILADLDGRRRCLTAGCARARADQRADDLFEIAAAWARDIDRAEGIALVREAEALARNGTATWSTIALKWDQVGEPAEMRRVLDAALANARTTGDALLVARAWLMQRDLDAAAVARATAAAIASTTAEWLAIAELAHEAGAPPEVVREPVTRAHAVAGDPEARAAVSRAYRNWVADDDAARRAGPRSVRPEVLRIRTRELAGCLASAHGVFDWLRTRVTAEQLHKIAVADYGMDAAKHLDALIDICDTGTVPMQLWESRDVLERMRWTTGDKVDHTARALACTLLCLATTADGDLVDNGVILIDSCLALGGDAAETACELADQLFVWLVETDRPERPRAADQLGPDNLIALLFVLALRRAVPDGATGAFDQLTEDAEHVAGWIARSKRVALWNELLAVRVDDPPSLAALFAQLSRLR